MIKMVVAVFMSCALVSCTHTDQARLQQERQAKLSTFRPIAYHRTGGQNQADEHITISQDRQIVSRTKYGTTRGELSEFQILQLTTAFEGWDALQPTYLGSRPDRNAAMVSISYGDRTVTVREGADGVPQQFSLARDMLVSIARDLPAQK